MQFSMHCYLNVAAPNMRCGITLLHVMSGVGSMLVRALVTEYPTCRFVHNFSPRHIMHPW